MIRPYKGCLIQKRLLPPLFEILSPQGTHPYDGPMAVLLMRIRYNRPLPDSNQIAEVPLASNISQSGWRQKL